MQNILKHNNLNNGLFNEELTIIINKLYEHKDKLFIKEVMDELNYKKINLISEVSLLDINKSKIYINCNQSYFYLMYTNDLGKVKLNLYENNVINRKFLSNILKEINKKEVFLYGKNYEEFLNILIKDKVDCYYYEFSENLCIIRLLNNV